MGVDEDAAQALDAELLDEAHAAHVGGQVIDLDRPFAHPVAVFLVAHVQAQPLHARHPLVPVGQRFLVDGPDAGETLVVEIARQRTADESAGPGDDDQVVLARGAISEGLVVTSICSSCVVGWGFDLPDIVLSPAVIKIL